MFRFFIYVIVLFLTGFIAIYTLFDGDNIISMETLHFSLQANAPFFMLSFFSIVIFCSVLFFLIFWFVSLPIRAKKSRQRYLYRKSTNELFDLFCDLDTESEYKSRMKKFNAAKMKMAIDHPIVDLADYKISTYVQNKEKHSRALARIKNNQVLGPLFYKEMILGKIHSEEYVDAKNLLLEFMKQHNVRPVWFYKTAIFIFSYLGDVAQGKDLINKAKKAGAIDDYALEMSNLYLNKAKNLEKEKADRAEILKYLITGLEYDFANHDIIKILHQNISGLKNHKKSVDLIKRSWTESATYEALDILSYLEPHKDDKDLKDKLLALQKKNTSDEARLSIAKFAAIKGLYSFAVEIVEKVHKKKDNSRYQGIRAFLEIVHLNSSNKEKLEILKKQIL